MLSVPKPTAKPFRTADHRQGAVKEKRNRSEQKPHENWLWFYTVCLWHFHKEPHYLEYYTLHTAQPNQGLPMPLPISPGPHFSWFWGHQFPVSFSTSATALPLPGRRARWSSLCGGWPQKRKHLPQVSWSHLGTMWHLVLAEASQQIHSCLSIEAWSGNHRAVSLHVPAHR